MAPIWDNNKPHGAFDKWWMLQYAGSLKTSPHLRLVHSFEVYRAQKSLSVPASSSPNQLLDERFLGRLRRGSNGLPGEALSKFR